jgi:hypothetical protein
MRWLILLHRYLGIAVGWLLVAWCLSGVVMMYVAYPEVSFDEYLAALPELELADCCKLTPPAGFAPDSGLSALSVEMMGTRPVARLTGDFGQRAVVDLRTGRAVTQVDADAAAAIAAALVTSAKGQVERLGTLDSDQWTVTANFNRDRPLHLFSMGDAARSQWYISSTSGALVQATTGSERFWNWIGAITHWLYPALLRQNGPLWSQVVIWSSVIGLFLTAFGLYIGISQLKRRRSGRWSPYRGFALWHHWAGLCFGLLTLSWLGSGLLSMNPWGLFEGSGTRAEAELLRAYDVSLAEARTWVERLPGTDLGADTKRIESAPFRGRPYLIAYDAQGRGRRYAASDMTPAPLMETELVAAAQALLSDASPLSAELLFEGDAYYFDHHVARRFPVYRAIAGDTDATRYYIDALDGQLLGKFDPERRGYRWLFEGLHRFDFSASLRRRPVWDIVVLVLLAGVTIVCFTGTYMGIRSVFR